MSKIKENRFLIMLIIIGLIIFAFVANMVVTKNKKIVAIVPAGTIEASTTVTSEMLKEIKISADTPGNFIRNSSSIIGSRIKNTVNENQLLYESDFMSSWTDYTEIENVPDDYVVTSIQVPDSRACGGIITAGDFVDVLLVNKTDSDDPAEDIIVANTWLNNTNTNANFVLANVMILTTDSALSSSQESDMSTLQSSTGNNNSTNGNFYVVALSYNDYTKLRIADSAKNSEVWLNICPGQNKEKSPLINQMATKKFAYLHDAQVQVMDENGEMLVDEYYEADDNGFLIDKTEDIADDLFKDPAKNDQIIEETETTNE